MSKIDVYNQNGEKVSSVLLPKEIFDVKLNPDLIHQVALTQMANRRKSIAHTKTRREVRGGGKKPWRQKGTGRARHGSIRSPLWRKGGITFGPRKEKIYKREIPTKMRRLALFMALSAKFKAKQLVVLDNLKIEKAKTKTMAEILKKLPSGLQSSLIILPNCDKNIILAARNLANARTMQAKDLNVLDLLSFKNLVMPKESIKTVKDTFLGSKS